MPGLEPDRGDKYDYTGKGEYHRTMASMMHVVNAAGICMFGYLTYGVAFIVDFMTAITGMEWDLDKFVETGERIGTLRHAFNLREGLNPLEFNVPSRMIGNPPLEVGNVRGVTVDLKTLTSEYLEAVDWDPETTRPSDKKLEALGLGFVSKDI